jgi:hypothetical protein
MKDFDRLYERVMRHKASFVLNRELAKKPLTIIDKDGQTKVFGYTLDGVYKELFSVKRGLEGNLIARNFVYKNTPINYYYHDNKKIKIPHPEER